MKVSTEHLVKLCLFMLALLMAVVFIHAFHSSNSLYLILLLQLTPLLLILPGLFLQRARSYTWLCFLMLFYFMNYVVQVYAASRSLLDMSGLILTIGLFIVGMMTSRGIQARNKQAPS